LENEENCVNTDSVSDHPEHDHSHEDLGFGTGGHLPEFLE